MHSTPNAQHKEPQMIIKKPIKTNTLLLIMVVMMVMPGCKSDLETIETITRTDEGPIESAFDVEIIYTDQAFVRMILQTPQMDRYENENNYLEMPQGLTVVFYDTLMQQTSSMSARYAISYDETEIIEARDDVIVINELGEKLNTEELIWDQVNRIIYSEKFVRITTEDEVTYGEGFRADERFDTWEITNPRGTFRVQE